MRDLVTLWRHSGVALRATSVRKSSARLRRAPEMRLGAFIGAAKVALRKGAHGALRYWRLSANTQYSIVWKE